tara:strand:- start:74 stop:433 length:360 start_codon:yes stop_codon:yes gene_type:complete
MPITVGELKSLFKIPKSENKISYNNRIDVKNKLEELMKYVIEELLYWDTDIDKDVLEETFFEFLYGPKDLKGMDVFVFGLTLIEWSDAIENEFCIIPDEAIFHNIETLTNVICTELKIG